MRFGTRHILTVIIVSVAILGMTTAMWVFQPISQLTYKPGSDTATTCQAKVNPNFLRVEELVDQVS